MLGRKHLRRGQQRTLITGIDHLQHRQHRHDGLAGTDLTLQHPIHRPSRRRSRRKAPRAHPVDRRSVRTASVAALRPPARRRGAVPTGPASLSSPYLRSASAHCRPTASSYVSRCIARIALSSPFSAMWTARSASSSEIRLRCRRNESGSGSHRVQHVDHLAHACVDVPALHLAARPDRSGRSHGRRPQSELIRSSASLLASAMALSDLASAILPWHVEEQECRMGQLQGALGVAHLTGQHHPTPSDQRFLMHLGLKKVAVTFGRRLPSVTTKYSAPLGGPVRVPGPASVMHVDERDVLAFLWRFSSSAPTPSPLGVLRG